LPFNFLAFFHNEGGMDYHHRRLLILLIEGFILFQLARMFASCRPRGADLKAGLFYSILTKGAYLLISGTFIHGSQGKARALAGCRARADLKANPE
jgi:hypothetical protein